LKERLLILTTSILLCIRVQVFAQNLVPNGSFENYSTCPNGSNYIYYSVGWFQPHKYPGFSTNQSSSSDYLNSCSNSVSDVPNNGAGYQFANTGNAYIGLALYSTPYGGNGFREYVEVKLSQELIANKKHDLQYFVSLANESRFSITKFDAHLSADSLFYLSLDFMNIPIIPQLQYNARIDDTLNWIAVNTSFIATGGERFLTLGNFQDGSVCDTVRTTTTSTNFCCSAYYYIDDVSLVEDTTLDIQEVSKADFVVYPNPSKSSVQVRSQQVIQEINLIDIRSRIVLQFNSLKETATIDVGQLEEGIYIVQSKFKDQEVVYKKIVVQH
jgi:Secretion system C-terminal sorting domain